MDIISHLRKRDRDRVRALKSPGDILLRVVTRAATSTLVALAITWMLQVHAQRDINGAALHRGLHWLSAVLHRTMQHVDQLLGVPR